MKPMVNPLFLVIAGLCVFASPAHGVSIEPNFTPNPGAAAPLLLCKGAGVCKEGDMREFSVEPAGFSSIKNDLGVTIKDIVLTILGPEGANWADLDGDGKIGTEDNIFQTNSVSGDGKTLTMEGGAILPGEVFRPLFDTDPAQDADVRLKASVSLVPEPSTLLLLGSALAALVGLRRQKLSRK